MADFTISAASSDVIADYLEHCFYSILYQRSVYPVSDFFAGTAFGGAQVIRCSNQSIVSYVQTFLRQIKLWIDAGALRDVSIVIAEASETADLPLERWTFSLKPQSKEAAKRHSNDSSTIREIQALMRQITASVTFLPLFEGVKAFEIQCTLFKAVVDMHPVPSGWIDSQLRELKGSHETAEFRCLTTKLHSVQTSVTYRLGNEALA